MASVTSGRHGVKPLVPVSVVAKWVRLPDAGDVLMRGECSITDAKRSSLYGIEAHVDPQSGEVMGYRFQPLVGGEPHDVGPNVWGFGCDCADGLYRPNRPGGCRHVQSLQQLLASLDGELAARAATADSSVSGCSVGAENCWGWDTGSEERT